MYNNVKSFRFWCFKVPQFVCCCILGLLLSVNDISRVGLFVIFFVYGSFEYFDGFITGAISQQQDPFDWQDT